MKKMHKKQGQRRPGKKLAHKRLGAVQTLKPPGPPQRA